MHLVFSDGRSKFLLSEILGPMLSKVDDIQFIMSSYMDFATLSYPLKYIKSLVT